MRKLCVFFFRCANIQTDGGPKINNLLIKSYMNESILFSIRELN